MLAPPRAAQKSCAAALIQAGPSARPPQGSPNTHPQPRPASYIHPPTRPALTRPPTPPSPLAPPSVLCAAPLPRPPCPPPCSAHLSMYVTTTSPTNRGSRLRWALATAGGASALGAPPPPGRCGMERAVITPSSLQLRPHRRSWGRRRRWAGATWSARSSRALRSAASHGGWRPGRVHVDAATPRAR